jgi:hypothetical protein
MNFTRMAMTVTTKKRSCRPAKIDVTPDSGGSRRRLEMVTETGSHCNGKTEARSELLVSSLVRGILVPVQFDWVYLSAQTCDIKSGISMLAFLLFGFVFPYLPTRSCEHMRFCSDSLQSGDKFILNGSLIRVNSGPFLLPLSRKTASFSICKSRN